MIADDPSQWKGRLVPSSPAPQEPPDPAKLHIDAKKIAESIVRQQGRAVCAAVSPAPEPTNAQWNSLLNRAEVYESWRRAHDPVLLAEDRQFIAARFSDAQRAAAAAGCPETREEIRLAFQQRVRARSDWKGSSE